MTVELDALFLLSVLPTLDDLVEVMLIDNGQMAIGQAFDHSNPFDIPGGLKYLLTEASALTDPGYFD